MDWQDQATWHMRMLRAWQLALLRFAVTLGETDRSTVMAIAAEIDRGGGGRESSVDFTFFRKTSADLCSSILRKEPAGDDRLRQYLAEIDDPRLTRAFASVVQVDVEIAPPARKLKNRIDLWRGLSPRGGGPLSRDFVSTSNKTLKPPLP